MERSAVLRVKRKRGGTEPAEALLLACKRLRTERGGAQPVERSLFKLVATVSSKNEPVQKYIQEAITRNKAQSLRPSLGSTQRIIQDLRSSKQAKRKENRYRVIASNRPNCTETVAPVINGETSIDGDRSDSEATEDASQEENSAVHKSSDCCGKFQLFDIVQEEEVVGESSVTAANPQKTDPDVILCNAVEMIRERLNLSEDRKKEHHEKEDEYVYDIYCMETSAPGWIQNILSVQPYREDYELVDDEHVPGEVYEDEDDENDENNWRNDYPDEDEFLPEEDGDGEKESEESFSDEDQCYRRRTWNKYRQEVLQEFGYDDIQDLDSD
ncbi:probable RNA polymerase II nuclear localization protein SLC7A6OS isoform X1 [Falco biarmicus]|uniref:probable RNA polymerase II nuclear localization protein SLC7A6OS isoform X1 n=1 Tax=Falco cherrug TaxID=345164 RepID=UPI002479DE7D|nr:probable RNA polymerase II nuclear localization protein SLC7A6OS isoform X1 [Falco cherrug]XP_056216389.1 probable RNA polymerase II nuclear localization protein SLC7A6OS isoform X1 [Falco biarmicus]